MERTRRTDIDWLRIGATYLLFVFHVGKVFDPAPFFHVRNAEVAFPMLVFCGFVSLWHMPLFFLLAGWSLVASLQARGTWAFVTERLRRLAIPLVAGCVLLAPAIKYLELRSGLDLTHTGLRVAPALQHEIRELIPGGLPEAPPFDESFLTFLPTFFTSLERFTWSHLWFVAYLLTLTLAYLPVFAWLARHRDRFATAHAWVLYLPLVPLVVVQLTMRDRWPGIYNLYNDWANIAYYSVFLVSGVLLACHPALERLVEREWKRSLALGTAAAGVLLLAILGVAPSPTVLLVGSAVAGWCFVLALLGIARCFFHATGRVLDYLSESAFPVYVLHQAAIVVIGYAIVALPLGVAPKFTLLLVLSVVATLAVYHWLVRPFGATRFLLGMRPNARTPRGRAALVPPTAAALVVLWAVPAAGATPVGLWHAEGGAARVAIEACGDALCGHVAWLRSPLDEDGCALRDRLNPDPALRRRRIEGLEILHGLTRRPDGTWGNGRIYDPTTGRTYACQLRLEQEDRLELRGYLGIPLLGRTARWTRVGASPGVCHDDRP